MHTLYHVADVPAAIQESPAWLELAVAELAAALMKPFLRQARLLVDLGLPQWSGG